MAQTGSRFGWFGWFTGLVLWMSAAAGGCNQTHDAGGGGKAGAPHDRGAGVGAGDSAAGAGGKAGAGGAGGTHVAPVDPTFRVYLQGSTIMLEVRPGTEKLSYLSCANAFDLRKRSGADWVPMQDDRHPYFDNPGYYLDGAYIPASANLGCDVVTCVEIGDAIVVGIAEEYVKTGSMAPPAGANSELSVVDVVETRPFHGELQVDVQYAPLASCRTKQQVSLSLTVPEKGVCCEIGLAQCSSDGPGGGWAPSADACPAWQFVADADFRRATDIRGCPVLVEDDTKCCGCAPEDAGI